MGEGHGWYHGALCGFVAGARRGQGQRLNDNRYTVITVNGQPLPLQPTGRVGEYVAACATGRGTHLGAAPDRRRTRRWCLT